MSVAQLTLVPVPCTATEAAMTRLRAMAAWEFLSERTPPEYVEIPYAPGKRLVYRLVDKDGSDAYVLIKQPGGVPGATMMSPTQMRALMKAFAAASP